MDSTRDVSSNAAAGPWLSILVPVYNVERYLRECLDSIMSEAAEGVEVIALDDVSADSSVSILRDYEARYGSRFKVMQQPHNRGISSARNTLLEAAQGRYTWFLDSDDLLQPGAVKELKEIVDREDPDLVLCDYRKLRAKTKLKHRMRGEMHLRTFSGAAEQLIRDRSAQVRGLFELGQMHVWSKICKRSLWTADLRFPEGKYYEDMFVSPRLAIRAGTCYYAPRVWISYRQREGSIMATLSPQKLVGLSEALVGFPDEFLKFEPRPDIDTRFIVSHVAARNFVGAARKFSRMKYEDFRIHMVANLDNLIHSTMLPFDELRLEYLRRGWIRRWAQLSFWVKQASYKGI